MPVANSTQLVAPTRLFARLKDDLAPFIYEVPPAFSEHLAVLKQLGCRDTPAPADLLDTLKVGARIYPPAFRGTSGPHPVLLGIPLLPDSG